MRFMGGQRALRLVIIVAVGGMALAACSGSGESDGSSELSHLVRFVPTERPGSMVELYDSARMRAATGAEPPGRDAGLEERFDYTNRVSGRIVESAEQGLGFGRSAEGQWAPDLTTSVTHPILGIELADIRAEVDVGRIGILAVDADPDQVEDALRSAGDSVEVERTERDGGQLLTAECSEGPDVDGCPAEISMGLDVWIGPGVLVAGSSAEVDAALEAATDPDEALRTMVDAVTDEGLATGTVVLGPLEARRSASVDAMCGGTCTEEDMADLRDELGEEEVEPFGLSMAVFGSGVEDGEAEVFLAVSGGEDERNRWVDLLRSWQSDQVRVTTRAPVSDELGGPAVDEHGDVVVLRFPVKSDAPGGSALWTSLAVGMELPLSLARAS